jgi:hypothetical protein
MFFLLRSRALDYILLGLTLHIRSLTLSGYVQHTSKNVKPYVLNYLYIAYNFISYTTNIQTTIQGAFP